MQGNARDWLGFAKHDNDALVDDGYISQGVSGFRDDDEAPSGQLAAEQVGQLQKLRELQLEDMTSKAAFQGYVIQKQAASEAATQWFFSGGPVTSDGKTYLPGLQ